MSDAPDFSPLAGAYAVARPGYPDALFRWLASVTAKHELAWDPATGSGQAALGLAGYFERVVASDISEAQIAHATAHPRIEYRVAPAEASGLPDASVDLVAVAAAVHWFDLDRFGAEVRRVTRPGGVAAIWTYHVGHVEPPFDDVFARFVRDVVRPYFGSGAQLVDDRYRDVVLPGEELAAPAFRMEVDWTAAQALAFVRTWSAVRAYEQATGEDPVASLTPELQRVWGGADTVQRVTWPLYLRAWRL